MKKHKFLLCSASCLSSMFLIIIKKYVRDMSEMKKKYEQICSYFMMLGSKGILAVIETKLWYDIL